MSYYNSNPFMDNTWESPPSRRPESIRLDSHVGGGIEFDNVSDSYSSDVFGHDPYEYKAPPQRYYDNNNNNNNHYNNNSNDLNNFNNDDGDIYIRSHPNTHNMNQSDYTVNLKPPNYNNNNNNNNSIQMNERQIMASHQPDPNNIFGKNSNNIGTTVEHNGRIVRYVNVNDLINKIGFGKFHYQLIFLCGLGYIADSMWAEAISLVIAPVQNEFQISNAYIGYLASVLYFGMCLGSFFWGRISDVVGRKFPFTLTLTIGGVSGLIATFIGSFGWILVVMFCLGFGVGGNIPVDGAILAEFLPLSHRGRIMVSLSFFWAFGDFVASLIAWWIVPDNVCATSEDGTLDTDCDPNDNMGWRYLVFVLGLINCSFLLFRLGTNESPNFLITQGEGGRRRALNVLKDIARVNGCPPNTVTDDMILTVDNPMVNRSLVERLQKQQMISQNLNSINGIGGAAGIGGAGNGMNSNVHEMYHERLNYADREDSYENMAPAAGRINGNGGIRPADQNGAQMGANGTNGVIGNVRVDIDLTLDLEKNHMSMTEVASELFNNRNKWRNLRLATPLIWIAWFGGSFGLTMFGTFLPKLLSAKNIHVSSIYGDALIFSLASLPGPFVGAYLVEQKTLGRRYTMTLAGVIMALLLFMFIFAEGETMLVIISCLIEFFCQIYFAGLMCYTPEAYPTDIRTTAAGIAAGIRHLANILAPVIGGKLFGTTGTVPVALATISVLTGAIGSAFLPFDTSTQRLVPTLSL